MMSVSAEAGVRPNRRGVQSRERVLDAAEQVMASEGFDAATVARVVEESGVPLSSVYHYYGSKDGVLLAVMERGAERFFADVPEPSERGGTATEHLRAVVSDAVRALERHPSFLRLLIVFAVQPPNTSGGEVAAVVRQVRNNALRRLRKQLAVAFDADPRSRKVDQLARFTLASIDGAFVASRSERSVKLAQVLAPLPDALVAAYGA
jgi:AcrR family transcriptional regulator